MPRLTRKPPKYSLHKPSGQAKVRSGGRTVYLGKYGSPESKEAYARFIACIPKPEPVVKIAEPAPYPPTASPTARPRLSGNHFAITGIGIA